MSAKNRNVVYSTDPDEDSPAPGEPALPQNPAAALPPFSTTRPSASASTAKAAAASQSP